MGLFDGIIWGNSQSSTTNPPADDSSSVIISETETLKGLELPLDTNHTNTPSQVDAFLNMAAGDITPEMPSYTERKAMGETVSTSSLNLSEDASSILITETEAQNAEANTTINTPESAQSDLLIEDTTPPLFSDEPTDIASIGKIESEKVDESPTLDAFSMSDEALNLEEKKESENHDSMNNSLEIFSTEKMGHEEDQMGNKEEGTWFTFMQEEEVEEANQEIKETKADEAMWFVFDTQASSQDEVVNNNTSLPTSTLDFLAAGLLQLEQMEKSLEERKQAFLGQAQEYKLEKEKFAELEKNALEDATSMDDEHNRILAMRKYFETQQKKQKEGSDITESVNTALTGIGVQNAVGNAMKRKTRTKTPVSAK